MQKRPIEVASDESGFSGTNLLDPNTQVFTHASVHLTAESARHCVEAVRARFPYSATEYKANQLLRDEQRPVLEWFLGPSGPIYGRAHVHLTDKAFFVVARLIDLLIGEHTYAASTSLDQDGRSKEMALALYREGPGLFGRGPWRAFLEAFTSLLRTKYQRDIGASGDSFMRTVAELPRPDGADRIGEIVKLLSQARPRVDDFQTTLLDDRMTLPPLEPLLPAVVETALYWGAGGRPVSIVHDEQSALTGRRVSQLNKLLLAARPGLLRPGPLLSVRLVDSRADHRVQVADLLAGAARRIAADELRGRGDTELTALLRPYIDPFSVWADHVSWSRLAPKLGFTFWEQGPSERPRGPSDRRREWLPEV
jgi:hypothetical protein